MADHSKIEWTDATWNPVTGCTEVSPGCDRCYAKTFAERFRGAPGHYFENGFDVTFRPDKLDQPLRWTRPSRVFVNSMSDLFHADVPDEFIVKVFAVMALADRHTFQLLTKRHGRMRSLLSSRKFREALRCELGWPDLVEWPLPNVWLGVSVEDQKRAGLRIPALLDTPAAVRFLSCEPLIGPVDLDGAAIAWWACFPDEPTGGIDWVIVGGESGRGARTMNVEWARTLRDQCSAHGVAFHFKQWGDASAWADRQGDVWHQRDDGRLETFETAPFSREHVEKKWGPLIRLSKRHKAGRDLDGRTWDEYPEVSVTAELHAEEV